MAKLLDCDAAAGLEVEDGTLTFPLPVYIAPVPMIEGGVVLPGLEASWDPIVSPYIVGIQFQYEPLDGSGALKESTALKGSLTWATTDGIVAGKTYRRRYRAIGAAENTFGPWTEWENITAPPDMVSSDTANVGGILTATFVGRVINVEALAATNATAISDLETIYGDTASAAASAAAAALSEAAAIEAAADAILAEGNAADSASASSASAISASSSAGAASTSATNAANSATSASGSASTATTQAGLAATSATNAGNSATAANTSAGQASTYATDAGNAASASSASAVSAAASYSAASIAAAMLFPDRYDGAESYFTGSMVGAPSVATLASNATEAGYGPVYDLTVVGAGSSDFGARGLMPAIAGRIYKVEVEAQRTAITGAGATNATIRVRCLSSSYADVAATNASAVALTGSVQTFSAMFSDVAGTGVTAWAAGAVWLRPHFRWQIGASTTATVRVRRLTVTDVTEQVAAATSASAAATSASSASTSATNAGTSASAASTSATNAATSAGAASTSATNASNSATTASGHASNASTSASAAAGSATAAGNSATAAAGSASSASTSATNAGNSATAASGSAVSAASSYTSTLGVAESLLPERTDAAGNYFVKGTTGAVLVPADIVTLSGFGPVRSTSAGGSVHVTKGFLPATPGKIYEITGRAQIGVAGSGSPTLRAFVYAYDANFAYLGSATATSSTPIAGGGAVTTASGRFGDTTPTGGTAWTSGAVWLRGGVLLQADATSTIYVRSVSTRDITAVAAAEFQASAAATSASSASTSATNAGSSATAASGSATTASTHASSAGTSATAASTSASNASGSAGAAASSATTAGTHATTAGTSAATATTAASEASTSAASASASAVLAASLSNLSLNKNAAFVDYPTPTGIPANWVDSVNGSGTRVTGEVGGYAYQVNGAAATASAIVSATSAAGSMTALSWYVLEAQVRLDLGALTGAGVRLRQFNTTPTSLGDQLLTFSTDTKNNTGVAIGAGTVGRTYRFAKLIQTVASTDRFSIFAETHSASHGSIAAANRLTWFRCGVRSATPEEVTSGVAVPALSASVTTLQGAVAAIEGRTAAWLEQVVEAGSGAAAFVKLYAETSPGVSTSDVSMGAREVHVYNLDGEDYIKALSVVGGNAMFYGGLSATTFIRQGSGDGWPVALKSVPFNLTDGQTVSWGTTFDSLPAYTTAMNNLAALTTAGEVHDIRLINITKTGATAYCKIIVPGAPSTYSVAAAFAGGTSAPDYTVGVPNAARLESTDGTYDLTIETRWTTSYKNYTTTGSDPFDADFNGTVTVNVYALKSGVWTSVGTQVFEHFRTYSGFHDSPAWIQIGPSVVTQTRTVNLGSGVQAIGVEYAGQTGAVGPYAAGTGEMDTAAWQGAATASSTRTATPSGALTRFTVIPQ